MKIKLLMIGLFVCSFAFTSAAQTTTPQVKKRQVQQQKSIKQGVKSGELTRKEVVRLEKQQRQVQRAKKRAKSDGVVTKKERARLHKMQNKSKKSIVRAKNNRRDRN